MEIAPVKNKAGLVYEELRAQIIDCTLEPGTPINESLFAKSLGVSKTPVREALRRLEREGLVSSIAGRGSIVSYITSVNIHETFEVREIIECGAARHAAALEDKGRFVRRREALLQLCEAAERSEESHKDESYDDLHLEIVDSVGNSRLSQLYREILDSIVRIRNSFGPRISQHRWKHIAEEHLAIIDAIIDGDEILAQERLREHLRNAFNYVISMK